MAELTRIYTVEITQIGEENEFIPKSEYTLAEFSANMMACIGNITDADHVVVTKVQDFIHDGADSDGK